MMKRPYRNIGFFFLLLLVLVVAGFTPRVPDMPFFGYFSQLARSGHAQIPLVIHLHALGAVAWFVLLCTQAFLIRANRTRLHRLLGKASVLVVASPVYKASYTGLLKSFFDLYQAGDLASVTAVGVLVAGQSGHLLAGEVHFRPLLTELGAATPTPVLTLLQGELPELDSRLEPWIARYGAGIAASVGALVREPEDVLV